VNDTSGARNFGRKSPRREEIFEESFAELPVGDAHIMTVSWHWRSASISGAARRVGSMMVGMLVAGIGLVLAGLLAIGFGIPIKEFGFGNTLILTGVIGFCAGAIMIGLWMAVRELKTIARRLGAGVPQPRDEGPVLPTGIWREPEASGDGGFPFSRDQQAAENAGGAEPGAASARPWQDEAASRGPRSDAPPEAGPAEAAPAAKPKRNLLFSSTSRKERERAQSRISEPLPPDLLSPDLRPTSPAAPPPPEPVEAQPASFDDAWPKPERLGPGEVPPQRRGPGTSSTSNEANGASARTEYPSAVTVLKSGVVDGMAYSLYSDGSIEAQMPEGMMRFASIDELRSHLDQRP
jgi:hypothetical protein